MDDNDQSSNDNESGGDVSDTLFDDDNTLNSITTVTPSPSTIKTRRHFLDKKLSEYKHWQEKLKRKLPALLVDTQMLDIAQEDIKPDQEAFSRSNGQNGRAVCG